MEENVELKAFTTFKIGGRARYFYRVKNEGEAREAVSFASEHSLPFFVLGGGSNLLAGDDGFDGVVIKNEISGISFEEKEGKVFVTAGAGENWDNFVNECVQRGLYGVENLSGIPGTVGGAVVQNVGAYGAEVKDTIASVEAIFEGSSKLKKFSSLECQFGYRDSFFKTPDGRKMIIVRVTFSLNKNGTPNFTYKDLKERFREENAALPEVRKAVLEIRKGKFPDLKTVGTAGSFFKNPIIPQEQFDELKKKFPDLPGFPFTGSNLVKLPLAWILDHILGIKGMTDGSVGLHHAQPLVLVNVGDAKSTDICRLANEVADKVKQATGIVLDWEVEKM
ncbi:MAG: UDP-N-acetylmuramate dehydrogenase [Candidatus Taylorbacteria bacterium]|nr:UDP-N-acetylmuramate dehydrogenase [Candidatus Taylorbacteria bacterium]